MYVYTNNELSGGCDPDWNQAKEYGKNLDISNMLKLSGKHWWCASAIKRAFWSTFKPAMKNYAEKLGESGQLYKASKFKVALSSLIIPHPEVIKLFDDAFAETFVPLLKRHCYNYGKDGKSLKSFINDLNLYGYMSLVPLALEFYKKGKDARKNTATKSGSTTGTGTKESKSKIATAGGSTGGSGGLWNKKIKFPNKFPFKKTGQKIGIIKNTNTAKLDDIISKIATALNLSIENSSSLNALIKVSGKPPKVILHGNYSDMSSKLATALKSLTKKDVGKDDYIAYLSEDGVAYKIPFDFKNIDALKVYDSNRNLLKETPASFKELKQSIMRLEPKCAK